MMLGIPFTLFVVEFCVVVLIFINTKNLLMFLLLVPIHGIAYALTVRDNRFRRRHPDALRQMPGDPQSPLLGRQFLQALKDERVGTRATHSSLDHVRRASTRAKPRSRSTFPICATSTRTC